MITPVSHKILCSQVLYLPLLALSPPIPIRSEDTLLSTMIAMIDRVAGDQGRSPTISICFTLPSGYGSVAPAYWKEGYDIMCPSLNYQGEGWFSYRTNWTRNPSWSTSVLLVMGMRSEKDAYSSPTIIIRPWLVNKDLGRAVRSVGQSVVYKII